VQASPGAFGAPGAAMQQLGQTIQTEGLRWLDKEVKTEQATTQATSENSFNEWFATQRANLLDDDPANWKDVNGDPISARQRANQFEQSAVLEAQRIGQNISHPTVRARVLSSIRNKIYAAMPTVHQSVRGQYTDYSTSEFLQYTNGEEERIAGLKFGSQAWETAIEAHKGALAYLAEIGEWDQKFRTQQEINSLERIDLFRFARDFSQVEEQAELQDRPASEIARTLVDDLETGKYKFIQIDKRDAAVAKATNRVRSLQEKEQAAFTRSLAQGEKDRKRGEEVAYSRLSQQIAQGRDQLYRIANGETIPADKRVEVPTASDIWGIPDRDMKPEWRRKLVNSIEGVVDIQNPRAVALLEAQILASVDPQDLETLRATVQKLYFDDRGIGEKGYRRLNQALKDVRDDLPHVKQKTVYQAILKSILSKAGTLPTSPGGKSYIWGEINQFNQGNAQIFFLNQIADGVRPHQAFLNAIDQYVVEGRKDEFFATAIAGLPQDLRTALGSPSTTDMKSLTQASVSAAWRLWQERADQEFDASSHDGNTQFSIEQLGEQQRGKKITQKRRLKIGQLYAEEKLLDMITTRYEFERVAGALGQGIVANPPPAAEPSDLDSNGASIVMEPPEAAVEAEQSFGDLLEGVARGVVETVKGPFDMILEEFGASGEDDRNPVEKAKERK
jgi:hypothetical protein